MSATYSYQIEESVETGKVYSFDGHVPSLHPTVFLAGGSQVVGNVTIGEKSSVWFNAVVRGDVERVEIGTGTNIQDGAVLHVTHFANPLKIGNNVTIGHGAVLHGCTIHDKALVGMKAVVLDRAIVGENSLVAAGSVVLGGTIIPPRVLAAGIPAKVIRPLSDHECEMVAEGADNYMMYVQHFREELAPKDWYVGEFA